MHAVYTEEVEGGLDDLTPSQQMLRALYATNKHIYGQTVPWKVKARRRAKSKVARVSRRKNRK